MTRRQNRNLIRIVLSFALLITASALPLSGIFRLTACLAAYLITGYDVILEAVRKIFRGQLFDEQFLMAIATIGAFVLNEYSEAVAVMLFYQVGEWFQSIAVGKSRKSIASLMDIRPDTATVIRMGERVTVSPEEVQKGEIIEIQPGERTPLDGVIILGETSVNTSALTGESLPVDLKTGDRIISGSINLTGTVRVQVESEYEFSTVNRILELVENASAKKARIEGFITRFSRVYTPIVVSLAVLIAFLPPLIFSLPFSEWIQRALIFLVVSCPCALVVSVPLSFFGGIGRASKSGILIKSSSDLEMLSKIKTMVFDKTGTLTKGAFSVRRVVSAKNDEAEVMKYAYLAERHSGHPIAKSICASYETQESLPESANVTEKSGLGVRAEISGAVILAGNEKLLSQFGIACVSPPDAYGAVVHIAKDGEYLGFIEVTDEIKPKAKISVQKLKTLGIAKTVLLTGDRREAAIRVKDETGIDEMLSELLPQDKLTAVEALIEHSSPIAFVGDGINDAPALTRADTGIAMGTMGSDAAIEAADVVLMDDSIEKLSEALKIAKKTMHIVRENIIITLGVKIAVMLLGAAGFANMWLAVFADVGVLIIAILNAMRTLVYNTKKAA
ncbi:MAG: cadmium-translocating P-type ATPase [Clostridia bacterium]|nr:cadmium-translocating P-type ATPase [Clostridia bacterium]